ncbi:hypothetical protein P378_20015 [Desulforamulus profundi]|uniref:Uncharacterized protein n=1 Tax=Desulforamulus profundi TaxID=1383067 RepID=A0A2C6M745_9FIRM|nr:replicative helicase loader/inhibitor [Desulforamulus profundi]PHJ36849.1 hypothetical protein P378_20015 [Desulforamulus profundi]
MTKTETAKLLSYITAVYPNIDIRQGTIEAWHDLLNDIPYEIAKAAVKKVLAEQEILCLPAVGKIRAAAVELTTPRLPSASEAWGEVTRAMRLYGYYRPDEALASMSPATAAVVKRFGWREMCACEEPEVLRGQFRMAYEQYAAREREMAIMPADIRQLINGVAERLMLETG